MKDDTISRAAALDALGERPTVWTDDDDYALGERNQYDMDRLAIETVPSAQPVNIAKLQPNCNQVASDCASHCASDCISRQAALEAMETWDKFGCDPDGKLVRYDDDKHYIPYVHYEDMVHAIKHMPPTQPGWIPCDRELPKPNEEDGNGFYKAYLVQDGRWMDVARWDGKYWIAWGYSTVLLNVVAWQPLPTPYREGGQENA